MRHHRAFGALATGVTAARVRDLVHADALAAARIEGVVRFGRPGALVDALFIRGDALFSVPLLVPTTRAAMREAPPFVWPARIAETLDDATADAVAEALAPWVFARLAGRAHADESSTAFTAEGAGAFAEARTLGLPGAAPLDRVARALAPILACAPFLDGRHVVARQADAHATYGVLAAVGAVPFLRENDRNDAFAARWFGVVGKPGAPDVATSDRDDALVVAGAVPDLSLVAYDPFVGLATQGARGPRRVLLGAGSPATGTIAREPARARSSRIVALGVRDDGRAHPDADTAAAEALAVRLRAEGLVVETVPLAETGALAYDVLHLFGTDRPDHALAAVRRARAAGKIVVVTPLATTGTEDASWGARVAVQAVAHRSDDVGLEPLFAALAARRLENDVSPAAAALAKQAEYDRRLVLAEADAVCEAPPFVDDAEPFAAVRVDAVAATAIEPRANLIAAVLAAADAGLRLALVGPIADPAYFAFVAAFGGTTLAYLGDLPEHDVARLVASAHVYVDVAWAPRGPARIFAAARAGAAVVHADRNVAPTLAGEGAFGADPASIEAVARALRLAATCDAAERDRLRARVGRGTRAPECAAGIPALYASLAKPVLN